MKDYTSEFGRLDAQHNGVAEYMGPHITEAPIGSPQRILEVGSGSGAWAIQAATQFPKAEVVAIDIVPLPDRPMPANITYQKVNIVDHIPFDSETFDVVHTRFVLLHLPHAHAIIPRLIELVKPGGYLLIEDVDLTGDYSGFGPGMRRCMTSAFLGYMRSQGQDPAFGSHIWGCLKKSSAFDKIQMDHAMVPLNPAHDDQSALANLGRTMKVGLTGSLTNVPSTAAFAAVHTPEIQQGWMDEVNDSDWEYAFGFYAVWARKCSRAKSRS
ncbi:S-adenosyl-L-methionine-dependent methyltransferase [Stereum hirsutum FP-91666 SS1]|uniref:S-adenosyl-L-methionine-dependent methyltransferase n=1 Tax=Stereum hirsutum (strain FP-91666) TaxID=721885 RepID=UPI00044103F3|nr:S-adenosyl-L-methionine-dependent methyltransferase [Stereum hirsutum FP-91666 SS1]EIM88710.1 S-adenosyl-L-methionine-dependent methyltransferase [Stereum hirsutum FP-91666 SS1]